MQPTFHSEIPMTPKKRRLEVLIPVTAYCAVEVEVDLTDTEIAEARKGHGEGWKKATDAAMDSEDLTYRNVGGFEFRPVLLEGNIWHGGMRRAKVEYRGDADE